MRTQVFECFVVVLLVTLSATSSFAQLEIPCKEFHPALDFPCLCPSASHPGDPVLVQVELVDSLRDQLRLRASA